MPSSPNISLTKSSHSKLSETDFSSLVFGKVISDHMFVADYQNSAWGDFRIVPYGPMDIYPGNATLHYGQAIFEGLKAYKNEKGEKVEVPQRNKRLLLSQSEAATRIIKAISRSRQRVYPSLTAYIYKTLNQYFPRLVSWLVNRNYKKQRA